MRFHQNSACSASPGIRGLAGCCDKSKLQESGHFAQFEAALRELETELYKAADRIMRFYELASDRAPAANSVLFRANGAYESKATA